MCVLVGWGGGVNSPGALEATQMSHMSAGSTEGEASLAFSLCACLWCSISLAARCQAAPLRSAILQEFWRHVMMMMMKPVSEVQTDTNCSCMGCLPNKAVSTGESKKHFISISVSNNVSM